MQPAVGAPTGRFAIESNDGEFAMRTIGLLFLLASLPAAAESEISGTAHVIDGNTIEIGAHGHAAVLRLAGIAAPEAGQPGADDAAAFLEQYAESEPVHCTLDGAQYRDHALATCYLAGRDIAAALVRAGLARDCPAFSNGRYWAIERPEAQKLPLPRDCEGGESSRQVQVPTLSSPRRSTRPQ